MTPADRICRGTLLLRAEGAAQGRHRVTLLKLRLPQPTRR